MNWALLNGSESKDDIAIKSYQWKQLSGPNNAVILKSNQSVSVLDQRPVKLNLISSINVFISMNKQIANATSLTLGLYEFELSVSDENNNTATDTTWVKIVQGE